MILYVTSFAEDMYNVSGIKLINSFITTEQSGTLLVCNESFDIDITHYNIIYYRIDQCKYLNDWLNDNIDYIPDYLGGKATEDKLPIAFTGANRKASRWFRKVVSLYYAFEIYGDTYDHIIWIDCDCIFKKQIPYKLYKKLFNTYSVFYYLGMKRLIQNKGIESGFIGFNKKNNGYSIIQNIMNIYQTKKYLSYERWDDGFIFRIAISSTSDIKWIDLAENSNIVDVINEKGNYFYDYISHYKGKHRLKKILV